MPGTVCVFWSIFKFECESAPTLTRADSYSVAILQSLLPSLLLSFAYEKELLKVRKLFVGSKIN